MPCIPLVTVHCYCVSLFLSSLSLYHSLSTTYNTSIPCSSLLPILHITAKHSIRHHPVPDYFKSMFPYITLQSSSSPLPPLSPSLPLAVTGQNNMHVDFDSLRCLIEIHIPFFVLAFKFFSFFQFP